MNGLKAIGALLATLAMTALAAAQTAPLQLTLPQGKTPSPAAKPQSAAPLPLGKAVRPPADVSTRAVPAPSPSAPQGAQTSAQPVVSGEAGPFDARQRTIIDRVSASLSNIRTLVGEFYQVAPDGSRSQGEFYLQKPGRLRFDYNPPSPVEVIADGRSVAVRDRDLATQDLYPISQTPLRFLLADRIDLLRDTNVVAVYADDVFVSVVIEERQIVRGKYRVMLMFSARDFQLKQWTVTDPQGYDTTVAVYNLDPNTPPDPELFKIDYTRYLR